MYAPGEIRTRDLLGTTLTNWNFLSNTFCCNFTKKFFNAFLNYFIVRIFSAKNITIKSSNFRIKLYESWKNSAYLTLRIRPLDEKYGWKLDIYVTKFMGNKGKTLLRRRFRHLFLNSTCPKMNPL